MSEQMKRHILVCDDEPHIRHIIVSKLRELGHDVVEGRDGQEGLEHVQRRVPDLVLTDYQMPRMSGIELSRRIAMLPGGSSVPVIMLTARGYSIDEAVISETGIRKMIPKPFGVRQLMNEVTSILSSGQDATRATAA